MFLILEKNFPKLRGVFIHALFSLILFQFHFFFFTFLHMQKPKQCHSNPASIIQLKDSRICPPFFYFFTCYSKKHLILHVTTMNKNTITRKKQTKITVNLSKTLALS